MKKEKITFDELALISFIKFAKLDGNDMTLLMDEISEITDVILEEDSDDYFVTVDGVIVLSEKYIKKMYQNVDSELFERVQLTSAYKRVNAIDMKSFVLKKIKLLGEGCVVKDDISNIFSFSQLCSINELYQDGYIIDYWKKEAIYDDYQAIKLTKRGESYLFFVENKKEIDKFIFVLRKSNFDENLLCSFLITQDLNRNASDILTIDNFLAFCGEYDRMPYVSDNKGNNLKRTLTVTL